MEDYEELANNYVKEFYRYYYDKSKIVLERLPMISNLFLDMEEWITDFLNEYCIELNWNRITKADFTDKEKLINDFYNYLGIDFNMQQVLNDGSLDITTFTYEEALQNHDRLLCGRCASYKNHHIIDVCNNDLITDAVVWIHEFAHYRNDFNTKRNEISNLLTEAISFTYEFMFLDYLQQRGFIYESHAYLYSIFYTLFFHIYNAYYALQLVRVYEQFGTINKDNYNMLFNVDNYDECIKQTNTLFIDEEKDLMFYIEYGIADALSLYMFNEYKKDNSFLEKIEKLNYYIEDKSLEECLDLIGITNFNDNGFEDFQNFDKIKDAVEVMKNRILCSKFIRKRQ